MQKKKNDESKVAKKKEIKKEESKEINKKQDLKKEQPKKKTYPKNSKAQKFFDLYDKYKPVIYGFVGGTLLTILVVILIWPDRIAKLKDGTEPVAEIKGLTVTADALYEDMKDVYSIALLLNKLDNKILEEKYPETEEMNDEITKEAENYYQMYKQYYQKEKEEFLSENGFGSEKAFIEYLRLNYRREKYVEEYAKSLVTDKEIEKYYNENVYGDINTKHILVKSSSSDSDEDKQNAENLAKEIITKLNEGKSFDEVKEEYKDKITYEELGYKSYNANLESAYKEEMQKLENNSYSKTPVKTSYGYHIVYRIDQKDKPSLEDVKDEIIETLGKEKQSNDSKLYYVALDKMRVDSGLKFSDTVLEKKYNNYMSQYK